MVSGAPHGPVGLALTRRGLVLARGTPRWGQAGERPSRGLRDGGAGHGWEGPWAEEPGGLPAPFQPLDPRLAVLGAAGC